MYNFDIIQAPLRYLVGGGMLETKSQPICPEPCEKFPNYMKLTKQSIKSWLVPSHGLLPRRF